jgi:uncharacterized protein
MIPSQPHPAIVPAAIVSPFHEGEVLMQKRVGVHDHVMSYAPNVIRTYIPDQHRRFYEAQPFLVIAVRDNQGRMWSTMLQTNTTSPDTFSLVLDGTLVPGDALEGSLQTGSDIGIIGIEFATRRRNRVNGRIIAKHDDNKMIFRVDQSFGNCPQYIKPRQWWIESTTKTKQTSDKFDTNSANSFKERSQYLSDKQIEQIRSAETIFLASGYRGDGTDVRYGNDASHRGGQAGFVHVLDKNTIIVPDYSGNNHFNTIGNLLVDPRIGITFPQYETGGMIQVTGRAQIIDIIADDSITSGIYPGAERLIKINIDQIVDIPEGSFPIRWSTNMKEPTQRRLVVSAKVKESEDVMSFHLKPQPNDLQDLWKFRPGQHLPIHVPLDPLQLNGNTIERTYTNSAGPNWGEYRISVKRQGIASTILHDQINIGDTLLVDRPAGAFILDTMVDTFRPIVLVSNGIGITPMISMLHHLANIINPNKNTKHSDIYWIHGARDGRHSPFLREIEEIKNLMETSNLNLVTHVAISQPHACDVYDSKGRLSLGKVQEIVPNWIDADFYICGNNQFVSYIDDGLKAAGVPSNHINFEAF